MGESLCVRVCVCLTLMRTGYVEPLDEEATARGETFEFVNQVVGA